MELTTWLLLCLVVLTSCLLLISKGSSRHRLPPGPRGLPLVGCPSALLNEFHVLFTKIAETWGDVVSINIMGKTIVCLNSAKAVREAFTSPNMADIFSGRGMTPKNQQASLMTTFLQPGPIWVKRRKILHKILNHYGEGLRETEKKVQEELTHVIDWLSKAGDSLNIDEVLYPSLINIVTILLKGRRYEYDSPVLANTRVLEETGARVSAPSFVLLLCLFPFLARLNVGPGRVLQQNQRAERKFKADYFDESKATYNPDVTRGMIDYLFHHQEESRSETGSNWMTDAHIQSVIHEMIAVGVLTTRGALYSFFLILLHKPEVASSIQNEIEAVIGQSRFPTLDDRSDMPYTNATMLELLRYIAHLPVGVPHQTTDDVTFRGYAIPKETTVIYNPWCFHHDTTWEDPWEFKPERFLDADGKLVHTEHTNRKNLMPFGIGRRSCVGEAFAKSRMFLFITTLLQRFHFTRDLTRPLLPCDPRTYKPGIVLAPHAYWLKVIPRG